MTPIVAAPHFSSETREGTKGLISIVVRNRSSLGQEFEGQLRDIFRAIARQCAEHVLQVHRILPPSIDYVGREPGGAGASYVDLLDDSDVADALGYHDETDEGSPYGKVFVGDIMRNGGNLASGPNSISVTASHEILEMAVDSAANVWADDYKSGYSYALEACDAVEGDSYEIDGVSVSNFVLPAWFDPRAPSVARFDWLEKLSAPFSMTAGGYMIRRNPATGEVSNVWGEKFPEWKKKIKLMSSSRAMRRAAGSPA